MKTRSFTIFTIGLLTLSLTVKYKPATKDITVNASALVWEWAWVF